MATVDPKRRALVKALMERDLYDMLDVPRDAGDEEILAAIARRTEWVEETPMRHADREAETHWLGWAERALVKDPEIRAEYDAALDARAAAEARAVESKQRVRKLREARDQLARREASRSVPVEEKKPARKAPTPTKKAEVEAPAGAGPEVEAVVEAVTETIEVSETPGGGVQVTDTVDVVEAVVMSDGEVEAVEVIDTVTVTEDAQGNVDATETIEVVELDAAGEEPRA